MFYQYILYIVYNMYLTMVKYNDLSLDFTFLKADNKENQSYGHFQL